MIPSLDYISQSWNSILCAKSSLPCSYLVHTTLRSWSTSLCLLDSSALSVTMPRENCLVVKHYATAMAARLNGHPFLQAGIHSVCRGISEEGAWLADLSRIAGDGQLEVFFSTMFPSYHIRNVGEDGRSVSPPKMKLFARSEINKAAIPRDTTYFTSSMKVRRIGLGASLGV